ncbi:Dynein beta chain, flagellar outer arm [Lamellibrachia satsuma]|nr:Dynein beta chain, flagellar outer arm [Lamellibrachia satsuma]
MELDDKLKWLEVRLSSSLRPHNEELKNLFQNDENRLAFHEFLNNEDVRRLFIYMRPPRQIVASLQPPHDLKTKSVFFIKNNIGVKLTKDNMDDEILFLDCMVDPLDELDQLTRDVYLPLLCINDSSTPMFGLHPDKLMDVLHRLMAYVTTTQGHSKGDVTLPLPSIEVLAEAASSPNRRGSVLHVLETTVIGWIKQIKGILKQDPIADLAVLAGKYPGPLDEIYFWTSHLEKLHSVNSQLSSAIAVDILNNLQSADSAYAYSFQNVRKDISKAVLDTQENLMYLSTMQRWFESLHSCLEPQLILQLFPPLMHTLRLVWSNSKYYHQDVNFHHLLRLISNEVVHRAEAMVGADVLREPLESYSKLKDALRVCAAFRGTYLDYRVKADVINKKNRQDHAEKMITRPHGSFTLFHTKMYGPLAYTPCYGLDARAAIEDEEQIREEELWKDSPWPPRNAPAFQLLNSFMERCNDVLELVQTTSHFRLLANAAEIGGAGSRSLDALVREIHTKYSDTMSNFFSKVTNVLAIDGTQAFEKAFFEFRTVVKDLESKLADVLRQSFHQCPTIGAQLRLLEVFEGISSRELVQLHLKDKDDILVTSFTKEVIQVRSLFQSGQMKPPLHKNMPPVVSNLMWVYALKQRIQVRVTVCLYGMEA